MANERNNAPSAGTRSSQPAPEVVKKRQTRNFTGKRKVMTDLFRLEVAEVIKHDSGATEKAHPSRHSSEFTKWPHAHPFYTYDKKGARLSTCVPIGGHFHIVEWEASKDKDEPPKIIKCSGPMVMGKRIDPETGEEKLVPVPANIYDKHTHEVEYIRSSEVEVSTVNPEAAAVVAMVEQRTSGLDGVTER